MNFRIQSDELPDTVREAVGFMANHAILPVAEVTYDSAEGIVSFPLDRFPVTGKSFFTVTRHAKTPVRCRVTFRNVTGCRIEDRTGRMKTIDLIFGFKIDPNRIYFCSSAESNGLCCYELTCQVSSFDIEIRDE